MPMGEGLSRVVNTTLFETGCFSRKCRVGRRIEYPGSWIASAAYIEPRSVVKCNQILKLALKHLREVVVPC